MNVMDTHKAVDYFKTKMEFTTGPVELKHMMDVGEDINIIDVRYPGDYAVGHIPGSINIPGDEWDGLEGLSHDKTNIVYCYSGVCHLAAAAAMHFAGHGYPVMELDGGFDEWKKHGFPVVS
jgi:rhodanese-related sulfurtransferase